LASFQVLPINTAGLLLLLLGLAMLVAELFLPSFGVVGVGGLIAFVLGSLFFYDVDEPGIRVDRTLIGGAAAAVGLIMLAIATLVVKAMRGPVTTGREALIGEICEVRSALNPRGTVLVQGELWKAESSTPLGVHEQARVVAVEGLLLRVEPASRPEENAR
jgi:membrane-bound serine protease (ClpP class)